MCGGNKYNPWSCGQIRPLNQNKCKGIRCGAYICYPIGSNNCNCWYNNGCGCGCGNNGNNGNNNSGRPIPWDDGLPDDPYWNWFDSRSCRT